MNFLIIRTLKKEHIRQSGYGKETKKRAGKSLKDATRVTVSVVSMYLMSQSLQVFITFWEAIHRQSLENQLRDFYSYANDVMSIMMLLGSFFRFPVYCTTNAPIRESSFSMLRKVCTMCWGITKHKNVQCDHLYKEVITESIGEKRLITDQKNQTENPKSLVVLPDDEDSNDCHEWML
ncbi:hypothetical protein AB6A40_010723 [Gnathostoma spinigerum]|uniref:G-protein coupled receptors family 1 profile domain-containing protein n=1 Tax=Gnathostoma spinigerum TaxID=75299 RepID=A0ABD6EVM1_9BILA